METGAGWVAPGADAALPAGDDPALLGFVVAGGEGGGEDFVVVGLFFKTGEAGEHDAHLDAEAGECLAGAVGDFEFQADAVFARRDFGAERDVVG